MKKESFFAKGLKVGTLLTVLVSARVATNLESTWRVVEAFSGKRVSCAKESPNFDAIVVPGAGVVRDADGNMVPNAAGRARLDGAAQAYRDGVAPRIVLVGEANLSKDFLAKKFHILEGDVVTTPPAINTATEMARVRDISQERGWKRIMISDSLSHGNRTTQLACNNGLEASWFPSHIDDPELKEQVELLLTIVDPTGILPTKLREFQKR